MKKILLLLVSGLFIACMAGSAMALELQILKDDASAPAILELTPKSDNYYDLRVLQGLGSTVDYSTYDVKIKLPASNEYVDATSSQVSVHFDDGSFVTPAVDSGDNNLDEGELIITLGDIPEGSEITFNVKAADKVLSLNAVASRRITTVPEFPTLAFPVAAVIGLVFIFGRKKDGL